MPEDALTIGELAAATGVATSAIRYYEDLGLLRSTRLPSGHRSFDPRAVGIVGVVLFLRDVGFTLREIKRTMTRRSAAPRVWRTLATRKVDDLDRQITKAQAAKLAIEHALACPQENILDCPNFWHVVGGLLSGKTLAETHEH